MLKRTDNLTAKVFEPADLGSIRVEWQELCDHALEDNVYYSPTYAGALLATLEEGRDVRFVTVWRGKRMLALMPVVIAGFGLPGVMPRAKAWQTPYTYSCTPLIDREEGEAVASELLQALESLNAGEWVFPDLYLDGPVFGLLERSLTGHKVAHRREEDFKRAFVEPGLSFDEHLKTVVKRSRRKDLNRCRRRLEELGAVAHESHTSGKGLEDAVSAFFDLEEAGWKGERGTALASDPQSHEFAKRVLKPGDGHQCRADVLTLDGKPVAAGVMVFSGTTGFTIKGSYDEDLATYSPGLLLELEILKSLLAEKWAGRLDASTAGAHVIDKLWPGRRSVGTLSFSFSANFADFRLDLVARTRTLKREAKATAKRLLGKHR